jgi:hypothetical protein
MAPVAIARSPVIIQIACPSPHFFWMAIPVSILATIKMRILFFSSASFVDGGFIRRYD